MGEKFFERLEYGKSRKLKKNSRDPVKGLSFKRQNGRDPAGLIPSIQVIPFVT